ncbi:ABC-F family ATP-binding cassette domain-containing protein [Thiomicrorhabdus heinhorstiae]|uniref:ABC-F family ATP-binding cassette domain-containing protein n=1 Tax=Thiomicrorhabdus heinhorstiae TaxID=2748010 RepID=A0ABS0BZ51_9GAMM|nr:ABC-F family ATP-binding cassette domain-containing protein [Thiomicrorhabdus heinhorstiae]MBF6058116.1 ABC-F family ATP-binding cassette domain-containing protein [Thiomicrorhabdus heinhorstiae]
MTHTTFVTLDRVRYQHPNGQLLFDSLSATFDNRPTGLVGDNGTGKSTLARILAGDLTATDGHVTLSGRLFYVPQTIHPHDGETLVDLLQIRTPLEALARIEQGSTDPNDFEDVGERWLIRQSAEQALAQFGLGHLNLNTPLSQLSGGEITRVALIGAFISDADFLILDEPTNHLDRRQRSRLHQYIRDWNGGLLVISHDRELLNLMSRTLELTPQGLKSYGGNFDFYLQQKQHEQQVLSEKLEHARLERKKGLHALQQQKERQQKRLHRAAKEARQGNQAKALLDFQKNRSQQYTGKQQAQARQSQATLHQNVSDAAKVMENEADYYFFPPETRLETSKQVLRIERLHFPFGLMAGTTLDLHLMGPQRVALIGENGCGKSTLLKLVSGQIVPQAETMQIYVTTAYIDQHASLLDPNQTVLQQLLSAGDLSEADARQKLAQIALTADKTDLPSSHLSGGERIKAALLLATLRKPTPQLLLLDEPTNHIDYRSKQALIKMLNQYQGALMVASHDMEFLQALNPTHQFKWERKNQAPHLEVWQLIDYG